jgi:hypothetical protein
MLETSGDAENAMAEVDTTKIAPTTATAIGQSRV